MKRGLVFALIFFIVSLSYIVLAIPPIINSVTIPAASMKVGDEVTATITVDDDGGDTYTLVSGAIDGFALGSLTRSDSTTYTATFTITEGGTDVTTAEDIAITTDIILENSGTEQSLPYNTPISQLGDPIDANSPSIGAVNAEPASGSSGIGDVVQVTILGGEIGLSYYLCNINNVNVSSTFTDNGDSTYSVNYTVSEGDTYRAQNTLPISCVLTDAAGNNGSISAFTTGTPEVDADYPVVTLPFYTNLTYKKVTDSLTLNVSATDASSTLGTCRINVGGKSNQTYAVTSNWCNMTNISLSGFTDGIKVINVYVDDSVTNYALNNSYYVTMDSTGPTIALSGYYTNGTAKRSSDSLTFNVSVSDGGSGLTGSACIIDINGTNQTIGVSSGWCNTTSGNLAGLSEGNNSIKVYVNDTLNNLALDSTYYVNIDDSAPTISIGGYYTNGTANQSSGTISFKAFIEDSGSGLTGSVCYINANQTNQTVAVSNGWCNASLALTGLSDGNNSISVYVNDTVNNFKSDNTYYVNVDDTAPTVTLPFYTNLTDKKNTDSLTLNMSVSDSGSGGSECYVNVGGGTNQTFSVSNGWCNTTSISLTGLADGIKVINVYANDTVSNLKLNSSFYVDMDSTAPAIDMTGGYDNVTNRSSSQTIGVNATIADAGVGLAGSVCLLSVGGLTNNTFATSGGACNFTSISLVGLADGLQQIVLYANDSNNNFALENTYYVNITSDDSGPEITLPFYTNGTAKQSSTSLTLNISVVDGGSGLTGSVCSVDINGTNQTFSVSNGWCNFTTGYLTGLSEGNNTISIYANDTLNNLALANTYYVDVDDTAPIVDSFSCTPDPVPQTNTITCLCSGSDATSGVSTTSYTANPSTLNSGLQSTSCTITDYAGNSASSIITYTVEGSNPGSGSSRGGGGSSSGGSSTPTIVFSTEEKSVGIIEGEVCYPEIEYRDSSTCKDGEIVLEWAGNNCGDETVIQEKVICNIEDCVPSIEYVGDWSECKLSYEPADLNSQKALSGSQYIYYADASGCVSGERRMERKCLVEGEDLRLKLVRITGQVYLDFFESGNDNPIAKILFGKDLSLNILLNFFGNNAVDLCSNGILDEGEINVDCGGGCEDCAENTYVEELRKKMYYGNNIFSFAFNFFSKVADKTSSVVGGIGGKN